MILNFIKKINFNKLIFQSVFNKKALERFKVNINTKCLVLSQYPGAEAKGIGGLIAQYPKNFEVLCLTNGSTLIENMAPKEAVAVKKQEFSDAAKYARIKGAKIFDIDDKTLKNHFDTFKKIDISEADYIFIPNVFDKNPDTASLLEHFKKLLLNKEHKSNLKIIMFESDYPLVSVDFFVNISSIVETKKNMLKIYYPEEKFPKLIERVIALNAFRSIQLGYEYVEAFMSFSVEEFLQLPMI